MDWKYENSNYRVFGKIQIQPALIHNSSKGTYFENSLSFPTNSYSNSSFLTLILHRFVLQFWIFHFCMKRMTPYPPYLILFKLIFLFHFFAYVLKRSEDVDRYQIGWSLRTIIKIPKLLRCFWTESNSRITRKKSEK